jgi:hypothetical protein
MPEQTSLPTSTGRGKGRGKGKKKVAAHPESSVPQVDPQELLRFPLRNHLYFARQAKDNFWPRTPSSSRFLFLHLKKHGLSFVLEQDYDQLQLEYLFVETWHTLKSLKDDENSYPTSSLEGIIEGYPFHEPGPNPALEPTYLIEEYFQDRLYTKPSAMVVPDDFVDDDVDDNGVEADPSSTAGPSSQSNSLGRENGKKDRGGEKTKKEIELVPITFIHLRKDQLVQKHGRIKPHVKGMGNTTAILCDIPAYVDFLEISLCMHAYLHYSPDLPDKIRSQTVIFERGMREFVRLFATFFYRGDSSVDTDTCKVHCFMHILFNTLEFGDPMQYESGKGERGLKQWAKAVSVTAQKVGLDTFLFQTIMRVADRLLLSRASDIVKRQQIAAAERPENDQDIRVKKRKMPHFRYFKAHNRVVAVDRKGKESPTTTNSGTISPNVIAHLRKVEKEMEVVDIWCEIKLPSTRDSTQPQLLRAHPMLDKFGGFFDWVDAKFDMVGDRLQDLDDDSYSDDEKYVAPAKLLAFYEDANGEECVIVHSVEWTGGKETSLGNTRLISNYHLEFQSSGWPAIRKIRLENIYRPLYVIERRRGKNPVPPKTTARDIQKEYVVSVITSRAAWAEMFYRWAKDEVDPWPDEVAVVQDASDLMNTDDESSQG